MRFYLEPSLALKLIGQYQRFREDRLLVSHQKERYKRDFLNLSQKKNKTELWADLEERYQENAPDLRHLVWNAERNLYLWGINDISIVLNRNPSSISRTLRALQDHPVWIQRLSPLQSQEKEGFYYEGIFDLIMDFYEISYIQRFTEPRRGRRLPDAQRHEILAFWNYLRKNPELTEEEALECVSLGSRPVDQPLDAGSLAEFDRSFIQALKDVGRRIFSLRVGTLFVTLYALYYEASHLYPWIKPLVPLLCLAVLGLALWLIREDRYWGFNPASLGAGVILFMILWGAGTMLNLEVLPIGVSKPENWPKYPDLTKVEKVSKEAQMPDEERRGIELFDKKALFKTNYKTNTEAYTNDTIESILPHTLTVDYEPVAEALRSGKIAKAWYGVNEEPKFALTAPPKGMPAVFEAENMNGLASEVNNISFLAELPDGTKAGPVNFPNTALKKDIIPPDILADYQDWGNRKKIRTLEDKGVVVTLYEGRTPETVNFTLINNNADTSTISSFSIDIEDGGSLSFYYLNELKYIPANSLLGFSNLFWARLSKNASWTQDIKAETLLFEMLKHIPMTLTVFSNTMPSNKYYDLSGFGFEAQLFSRERIGHGYEIVTMKIRNNTGRKITGFESYLEACTPDGKLLERAAASQFLGGYNAVQLYHGSEMYMMRYVFRSVDPFPEDVHFRLRVTEIGAWPAMMLATP